MSKRNSFRYAAGTTDFGTACVSPDRNVPGALQGFAQRALHRKNGVLPPSEVDDILSCVEPAVSLAPQARQKPIRDAPGKHCPAGQKRTQARGRLKAGKLNNTEGRYAQHLEARRRAGEIEWFLFEGWKLRLADNTFYTPDFVVMRRDGAMECHEVKGFWRDDARVKIKVAAYQHPLKFIAVTEAKKGAGGGWLVEEF